MQKKLTCMRVCNKDVQNTNKPHAKKTCKEMQKNSLVWECAFPSLALRHQRCKQRHQYSWFIHQFTSFDSFKHTKSITQNAALQTPTSITIYAPGSSIYSQFGCSPVIENNVWGPDFVPGQSGVCDVVVPANNFISFHVLLIYFDKNFFLNRTRECFSEHIGLEYDVIVMSN